MITESNIEIYTKTPNSTTIKKLPKLLHRRLTDKHILVVPVDFICNNIDDDEQKKQAYLNYKLMPRVGLSSYKLQLGYVCLNKLIELINMEVNTMFEEDVFKNVQPVYLSKFDSFSNLNKLHVTFFVCKQKQ